MSRGPTPATCASQPFGCSAIFVRSGHVSGIEGPTAADHSYRLNSSAALVPPKPNELESAYSIGSARFVCGT